MALFRRGDVWWYKFWFAGQRIRESTKSGSKTIAKLAEKTRRRDLEEGFNNTADQRQERIRTFRDLADEFFDGYKVRLPDSTTFAEYAIDHLKRLLGNKMQIDFNESVVINYQNDRLEEGAAPKTINEEVGFLLRILDEPGDVLRVRLRKKKMLKLKVRNRIGKRSVKLWSPCFKIAMQHPPKRIVLRMAQDYPQQPSLLKGSTHKSPRSRLFWTVIGECTCGVGLRR